MSSKLALCEDKDMMDFQDLYASPAKSETSSVDIYDGLDMSVTLPGETTKQLSPSRDCLDLYEEIITEEGTAKEESFNNLNVEYEKCQKQIKQLISKLKEMQGLNSNLQSENQCLKKNISALIKTARVEITRKEEEINRLNQRLSVPGSTRSLRSDPVPLLSVNSKLKEKDLSKDTTNKPSNIRKEEKSQGTSSKDLKSNYASSEKLFVVEKCIEINSESNSKPCFKEIEGTEKQTARHKVVIDKKTTKQMENQNREVDRWKRSEGHRSSHSTVTDDVICEVKERSHGQPTKTGKHERSQESRNSLKSNVDYKTDSKKHSASSHEKPSSSKENTRSQELHNLKEKHLKTHEKSEHRKESKGHERDKTVEHRHKKSERDDDSKKSKRTHSSSQSENSQKSSPKQNAGKRSTDSDIRNKHCSDYSDSKNVSKDSKMSKTEVRPSATKNKTCNNKSLSERDSRTEKNRSKEEISTRSDQNRGHRKEEKVACPSSNKVKMQVFPSTEDPNSQNFTKGLTGPKEDNVAKDLKLSFMETLNLTLSPAKKKSQDSDPTNTPESAKETDVNSINTEASSKVLESTKDVLDSQEHLCKPSNSADLKHDTNISVEDDLKSGHHSEPGEDTVALDKEQSIATLKGDETVSESIQSKEDCPQVLHTEPEGNISDDMDTHSILNGSDLIVLDSYIETEKSSSNEISSENLSMSVPAENIQDDEVILAQISEDVDQTSSLKSNITGATTGICESSNTALCVHDESSVMSLDLNFLRLIPKIVSPLKSPAKPLAHLPTPERTAKASVVSVSYKDQPSDVNISTHNELNKENCEPVSKTDLGCETFPIEISSDEVEEGEIISDVEPDIEQSSQSKSSSSQIEPIKDTKVNKSPVSKDSKMASLTLPNGVISPLRKSASETLKKAKPKKTKLLALPIDKRKNADSCLEGVLKIVPPSNIQDVLQMLRIIRKHIRKKYMKFKIQFPLTQFHRFVEAASLCFTTLASRLDWSKLCSSTDRLQNKLCKLIESRLKQLKKNGIVDRIFEQKFIDMKKRLWKFVEEQLDSLFDSLKGMMVKLCDKAKLEHDQEEKKMCTLSTKVHKADRIKKSQGVSKTSKIKVSLAKSENDRCLRRLDLHCPRDTAYPKPQTAEDPSVEKKLLKDLSTACDKNAITPCPNTSPKPKMYTSSTAKPDTSSECQKDQHSSAALSFNLVSDDHMGDIFKSLLSDNDNLELNTLHENIWVLDTPEKKSTSSKKYDSVHSLTEIITTTNAAYPWPSVSPPRINTMPRFEPVLTPDVFDESCLLEVPTSASSSNKSISASEEKLKSYSVLMDDLAVSLTVPSPLKSDSHLSFLRPVCDPVAVSQVNVNYSEDAVLDEEDATEQDIHLTLDSDNSSTGSLENLTESDGFQCHPSEPMQAVIMEKSNDHFIVKIRRAVPYSSPISDSSSLGESYHVATRQMESTHCSLPDEGLQHEIHSDTTIRLLSESTVPISEKLDSPKCNADEKFKDNTDLKQHKCSSPKSVHAMISILPDALNQSLKDSSQIDLTNVSHTEKVQVDCEKLMTVCPEKNLNDCYDYDQLKTSVAAKQLMVCEKMVTPTPCAETFMESVPKADSLDLNQKKKKRRSSEQEPLSKRRNISFLPDIKDKKGDSRLGKTEDRDKPQKKHRRAVSEGNINFTLLKHSPSSGISAKNVIKKKGEVVVSWTRNEDREILLECQQHGPNRKAFLTLASKMSKYPHQVEERFRQLMKLFKKSKNSIS